MKTTITLTDLQVYAYHGVLPQERLSGNAYVLNLTLTADLQKAMQTDDLQDTLNYAEVTRRIKEVMAEPVALLEHAAYRILKRLYADFPQIEGIDLHLQKMAPPVREQLRAAGIRVSSNRQDFENI